MNRVNNVVKFQQLRFHAPHAAVYFPGCWCPHLEDGTWARYSQEPLGPMDPAAKVCLFWAVEERGLFSWGHEIWLKKLRKVFTTMQKWFCLLLRDAQHFMLPTCKTSSLQQSDLNSTSQSLLAYDTSVTWEWMEEDACSWKWPAAPPYCFPLLLGEHYVWLFCNHSWHIEQC